MPTPRAKPYSLYTVPDRASPCPAVEVLEEASERNRRGNRTRKKKDRAARRKKPQDDESDSGKTLLVARGRARRQTTTRIEDQSTILHPCASAASFSKINLEAAIRALQPRRRRKTAVVQV